MCSIGEDDFGDDGAVHAMTQEFDSIIGQSTDSELLCKKCNEDPVVVKLSNKDAQCKKCFMNYARHKFRATLGCTKIVKKNSKILLVIDGNPESLVMADMVKYGVDDNFTRKLYVDVKGVLYLDESFLIEDETNYQQAVLEKLEYLNMPLFYMNLADQKSLRALQGVERTAELLEQQLKLKSKIGQLNSLTEQQDYVRNLRSECMNFAAKSLDISFVFTPEINIDIAKTLLTDISLGRGASVASNVAFHDTRPLSFDIIRPMRDLTKAEIDHYLCLNNFECIRIERFGENKGADRSIQNLTSHFVNELQMKFPATISTVSKTGERISEKIVGQKKCKMCKSTLDYHGSETLFATEYSRIVSKFASEHIQDPEYIENEATKAVNGLSGFKQNLCHGCRNIFIGLPDDELIEYQS